MLARRAGRRRPRCGDRWLAGGAIARAQPAGADLGRRCCRRPRRRSTDGDARGNLVGPLDPLQVAGIWPAGDFRFDPGARARSPTLLIAVACRRRDRRDRLVRAPARARRRCSTSGGALVGCAVLVIAGSPWVGGKALATASLAIPFAAMLGAGLARGPGWRAVAGAVPRLVVERGRVWSNALGYGDVNLAPRGAARRARADRRAGRGQGPTLITEYSPYGARHFLRDADPEAISELRRRTIPLRDGSEVPKGGARRHRPRSTRCALGVYRTLVVRRSPAAEPAARALRAGLGAASTTRSGSGRRRTACCRERHRPRRACTTRYGVPACDAVLELAGAAVTWSRPPGPPPVVVPLSDASYPAGWATAGTATRRSRRSRDDRGDVEVARAGEYEVWLGGSLRPRVEAAVDGEPVGRVRHQLNNEGGTSASARPSSTRGRTRVEIDLGGADLHPGSAGNAGRDRAAGALRRPGTPTDSELVEVPGRRCAAVFAGSDGIGSRVAG